MIFIYSPHFPTPHTPHPTPHTPHPTPHTLHPTPYTPHPTPHFPTSPPANPRYFDKIAMQNNDKEKFCYIIC
ncbi:hypothetical protein ED562_06915 [Microcystis aeruginosa FACHB-524]|nr:hypothetical protein ED562_06915 [Microcystis aeruginosa FACHB-524]